MEKNKILPKGLKYRAFSVVLILIGMKSIFGSMKTVGGDEYESCCFKYRHRFGVR